MSHAFFVASLYIHVLPDFGMITKPLFTCGRAENHAIVT